MKVLSSLKDAKNRHRDCQVVRRRDRIYVICKSSPRFKRARQRQEQERVMHRLDVAVVGAGPAGIGMRAPCRRCRA